ncbi:hypothetical protein ScalyP_jg158 [Parmales sp. scaly parma]|nr:hypothetical protein ScalyP_jg158 [Parmales sp. scaly parma]
MEHSSEVVHRVYCYVHRVIQLDSGESTWDSIEGDSWALLEVIETTSPTSPPIYSIRTYIYDEKDGADIDIEFIFDSALLKIEGQWNCSHSDFVELMTTGGEMFGLSFPDDATCLETNDIVMSCFTHGKREAYKASGKKPSYKEEVPPAPDSTPPSHPHNSVSLMPPECPGPGPPKIEMAEEIVEVTFEVGLEEERGAAIGSAKSFRKSFPPAPERVFSYTMPPLSTDRVLSVRLKSTRLVAEAGKAPTIAEAAAEMEMAKTKRVVVSTLPSTRKKSLACFSAVEMASMAASCDTEQISHEQAVKNEILKISSADDFSDVTRSSMSSTTTTKIINDKLVELKNPAPPKTSDNEISHPTSVKTVAHTVYNEEKARYEGLPVGEGWRVINTCFGVPLNGYHKHSVDQGWGKNTIPSILVFIKKYLMNNGGKDVVGIFRLAPNKDDCNWTKKQLNDGTFESCDDVNIFANLIKVWFRNLPVCLLDCVEEDVVCKIADMKFGQGVNDAFEGSCFVGGGDKGVKMIFLWLLDLCAEVVGNEKVNKMTAKNIAICISPNLYSINASEDGMAALRLSQKVADFMGVVLKSRMEFNK